MIKKYLYLLIVVTFLIPKGMFAATISFVTTDSTIYVGDTRVINVILDTEGEKLNAVDGSFSAEGINAASIKNISIANSGFSLWPNTPSVSPTDGTVSFVGGVPNGIKGKILLFRMFVEPKKEGIFRIATSSVNVYSNDGTGSSKKATLFPLALTIAENSGHVLVNEEEAITEHDKNIPQNFSIEIGRDPSVYDNKYFISFDGGDSDSGIDYYEVTEGNNDPVRSSSPYVLQHQDPNQHITVTAYDRAGNIRTVSINNPQKVENSGDTKKTGVVVVIVLLLLSFGVYVVRRNRPL